MSDRQWSDTDKQALDEIVKERQFRQRLWHMVKTWGQWIAAIGLLVNWIIDFVPKIASAIKQAMTWKT